MTVSKIRLNGTDHDIRAKYLIQSSSADAVSEEFVTKTTTEDAIANIQKIYGNTIKFNQLVQNGNFDGITSWTTGNSTVTVSNNVASIVKGSQSIGGFLISAAFPTITSHLYYIAATLSSQTSGIDMNYGFHTAANTVGGNTILSCNTSSKQRVSGIVSPKNTTDRLAARIGAAASAVGSTGTVESAICVDLTQMYGSGNEPTLAEFEAEFNQPYYDYNPSGLLSVKATSLQSKDSGDNVIGNCDLNIPTLTGKLNGAGSSVVIFPDGMKKAGTVYDEIVSSKAIKRTNRLNLGDLTWSTSSQTANGFVATGNIPSDFRHNYNTGDGVINATTPLATQCISASEMVSSSSPDMSVSYRASTQPGIFIKNSAYAGYTATQFKTAVTGIYLDYEIATPEEYILDNALQIQYPVVAGGTEMVLPTTGTAPMKMDVIYGNAADAAANMSQNFISVDSMKNFLSALGTQMNGTWAMQYSGGKYTFTFTSN